jgi:hypothetical protein
MTTLSASRNVGNLGMMFIYALTFAVVPAAMLFHAL